MSSSCCTRPTAREPGSGQVTRKLRVLVLALAGFAPIRSGAVIIAFFRLSSIPFRSQLRRHWLRGLWGGRSLRLGLGIALLWLGLVYGLLDGLMLTVAPVLAVFGSDTPSLGRTGGWRRGALALGASLLVTAAYHLGYDEFRGPPLHGAAVLHGMETTTQLPPHYPGRPR